MGDAKKVVLIADDSITNLHVLNQILSPHYRIKATRSGLRAVDIALRDRPDAVLLDLMMPDLDGTEACRRIKAAPGGADLPVLFITGSAGDQAVASCSDAGGARLLTKPIDRDELLAAVSGVIAA